MNRLLNLLSAGDGEAIELAQAGRSVLSPLLGEEGMALLLNHLETFDFDSALRLLQAAVASSPAIPS